MIDAPCHGCRDRHKGCHACCEDYLAYVEQVAQARLAEKADRQPQNIGREEHLMKYLYVKKKYNSTDHE